MNTLQIHIPSEFDLTAGATRAQLEALARVAFAVRLFELGIATTGQAAEIAEMPRRRFLVELADQGIPAVSWDSEELEAEMEAIS